MIDLHCHSLASDGSYSPKELVKMAEQLNISHLALTDHDTTAGIGEFMEQESTVKRIPGIEISVEVEKGELHIVGLFIDINDKSLKEMEEEVQYYRKKRNEKMLAALSKLVKKNVKIDDLVDNPNSQLGRPHVAKYLLRNNIVTSIQEAFDLYLKDGAELAFKKQQVSVERALNVIKNAGGISVKEYKQLGLNGLEAYSSHNPVEKKDVFANIARQNGLIISCGSDFHGANGKVASLGADIDTLSDDDILTPMYDILDNR